MFFFSSDLTNRNQSYNTELQFENYFVLISEGNWPFWVAKNSISSIDFIVNAIVDSSSDDCPVPYGPNVRALDVANITLAKQTIPKNLFRFFVVFISEYVGNSFCSSKALKRENHVTAYACRLNFGQLTFRKIDIRTVSSHVIINFAQEVSGQKIFPRVLYT